MFTWVKAVVALYMWSTHHLSMVNRDGVGREGLMSGLERLRSNEPLDMECKHLKTA